MLWNIWFRRCSPLYRLNRFKRDLPRRIFDFSVEFRMNKKKIITANKTEYNKSALYIERLLLVIREFSSSLSKTIDQPISHRLRSLPPCDTPYAPFSTPTTPYGLHIILCPARPPKDLGFGCNTHISVWAT